VVTQSSKFCSMSRCHSMASWKGSRVWNIFCNIAWCYVKYLLKF